jgi:hypothetical protein
MEEHKAHVRSVVAPMAAGEMETDADLAKGLASSPTQQDTSEALKTAYDSEIIKLDVLSTRHTAILSELSLWEGTLKEVKRLIGKRKNEYTKNKKRVTPGPSEGSTEVDLTDVNEWALSSSSSALTQRVRDPLYALNAYDNLAATWAEQPLQQEHPFSKTVNRSTLTKPKGGENIQVLCKTTATIIFYKLPADTASCLRFINNLDFPRPATRLRVIKPKGPCG